MIEKATKLILVHYLSTFTETSCLKSRRKLPQEELKNKLNLENNIGMLGNNLSMFENQLKHA
jgi:hypothetical protein